MRKLTAFISSTLIIPGLCAQMTIENLLSPAFPTSLTGSLDGKHIAWVFNDKGVRNVFVADAPEFKPRKLTNRISDNGLEIGSLSFTRDGRSLLFTEGNTNNPAGEAANPAMLQVKTGQFVWVVSTDGSGLRRIGAGDQAVASPDNRTIVYLSSGKLWRASLIDTAKSPEQCFEARGSISDPRWSPDGKKVSFISHRGDHSLLGIYDMDQKALTYPDPSVDRDIEPVWSPDGRWIAYIRTPGMRQIPPFTAMRAYVPWSIRLLDVQKATARELWKASEGKGSVLFLDFPNADNFLLWAADDQLVFPWEKDGWQHLYAIDIFRKTSPRLLTPGDGEVEYMALSSDHRSIIYNTNIGDSHRRHICSVRISGGEPVHHSQGDGIEWSPVNTSAGIAVLRSTATMPAWPSIIREDGRILQLGPELFPAEFPAQSLVTPQVVSFKAKDGIEIHAEIFLPAGYQPGKKYPALLFLHGGSRRQMLVGFHYMNYYSNDYAMNQYYVSKGYIVLAVNYRSGIGYGLDFREALEYGANGASEYNDVIAAGLYLRGRQDVDGKRIGLWGGSYGGFLTAMGLARNSDVFACGVDIHGVHDWSEQMKNRIADFDISARTAISQKAISSSPVYFAEGWKSPVLFIHGDDDRNVPFSQTVEMIEQLRKGHVYFEQLIIPDEIHDFLLTKTWINGYHTSADFFERMMK